jgi:diacylglycerol kinase family enzyme
VVARPDLVLNRRARYLAGEGPVRRALLEAARDVGARVHETTTLSELDEAARSIASGGTACVVLAGGDGSYMAGVSALVRAFGEGAVPPIALAPGGTVGTVARNWMADRGARAVVTAAASAAALEHATLRPTLRVTDDAGGDRVGFIFGAGLVARFFDEYYASSRQGYAAAAAIVARIFAGSLAGGGLARRVLEPVAATLAIDGREAHARAFSLVLASVVRDVGLHMLVTPRGGERVGAFHAVASPLGPRALGPQLLRVVAGEPIRGRDHLDEPAARELDLRFAARDAYVLDGDIVHAGAVGVRAGPAIRVVGGKGPG